ncbi:MAG TPA: peptidyl-alpha-hydroxyglycine alpha-amidating lyase family protein [Casimicrobiaceae bacterium]|nr:peptidyl-alpha-hydroxyglycine alpha-amidating lyase family protein [Casimicrobiaceae bacterium]
MATIFGSGEYAYRIVDGWPKLPDGWRLGDVAGVGVDRNDRVYLFHRGEHPLMVFERDGSFVRAWGDGVFRRAHGVHVAPDDTLWLTDEGDHTVRHCTFDGKVLVTIGVPDAAAPFMSGEPFRRCTHTALSPDGEVYVSDGYGNARIHKYAPDGRRLMAWGRPGTGPGEFNLPHNIGCDADGWVYVADRENHRIQVFDGDGRFETEWRGLHRPSGMHLPHGRCPVCYVGEIGPYYEFNRGAPNLGPRISILANDGKLLARIGVEPAAGEGPGQFLSPHGLAVDSRGDLYVGEVSYTAWPNLFPAVPLPQKVRSLQKFERVPAPV